MNALKTNLQLDVKGLACPMPVVRAKKAMNDLAAGQVLEIIATDKGSVADLRAWAKRAGHQYVGLIVEEQIYKHYIRKLSEEDQVEMKHPAIINNDELKAKLDKGESMIVIDVREEAEFVFGHIPNAISIPLGELTERIGELNKEATIYLVCRSGNRSDLAAQQLAERGFINVFNVVPGMSEWTGPIEGIQL